MTYFLHGLRKSAKWIFISGLALFIVSSIFVGTLPKRREIDRRLMRPPAQAQVGRRSLKRSFGGRQYALTPRYKYTLYGLVVSTHDQMSDWFNIDYWKDPLNVKDICVIWGRNVMTEDYRKVSFSSGLWTCRYHYGEGTRFFPANLSNNHILPANEKVMRTLKEIRPGDQIALQGLLVDYKSDEMGSRKTSTSRTDRGMNACEVIYVQRLKILRDANPGWGLLIRVAKYIMLGACGLWVVALFFFPMPNRAPRITSLWR